MLFYIFSSKIIPVQFCPFTTHHSPMLHRASPTRPAPLRTRLPDPSLTAATIGPASILRVSSGRSVSRPVTPAHAISVFPSAYVLLPEFTRRVLWAKQEDLPTSRKLRSETNTRASGVNGSLGRAAPSYTMLHGPLLLCFVSCFFYRSSL